MNVHRKEVASNLCINHLRLKEMDILSLWMPVLALSLYKIESIELHLPKLDLEFLTKILWIEVEQAPQLDHHVGDRKCIDI